MLRREPSGHPLNLRSVPVLLAVVLGAGHASAQATEEAAGEWTGRAPLPEARTEVSVTTDGERIWLIGGFGPDRTAPRTMYVYDPAEDAWPALGEIPQGVNHAGFAHLDGRLYIVGGYQEATFEPTDALRIYDLDSGEWQDGAPLPTARGALAVAVLDGAIHAIAGATGDQSVGTHEVYDPASDSWRTAADLPTPRNHTGAAVVDGQIHVVAGRDGGDDTMTVHEVYDPESDSWSEAPPVPTGRSGIAVVELDGRVYVFGGETFGNPEKTFDEAERYDPAAGSWQALPPMPTARHGLGAAALGDSIYVIAGGPEPGFAFSDANERLEPAD